MSNKIFDYIIIGAGPAGLQLGSLLAKNNHHYLILEGDDCAGAFFKLYPRHRKLISINKRYTGTDDPELKMRMDWNSLLSEDEDLLFTKYSERYFPHADDMVTYLGDFAKKLKLNIQYNTYIKQIKRETHFILTDANNNIYRCKRLVVATGVSETNHPNFTGADLVETYDSVSVDPNDFINQRVLIIGTGNSAFETADNIIETASEIHVAGASSIKLAWKTHFVGHLRAVNNNFLDTYQLKSQNAILDGHIIKIEKVKNQLSVTFSFSRANEVQKTLVYNRVIACTGFRFNDTIFDDKCKPAMTINNRFPALTASWESTNVSDLYFAGTLMQMRDYKKSTSGFVHGFRYGVRTLFHMLEKKYHKLAWPNEQVGATSTDLTDKIIARVNRTSALWQQFEFMCDLIVFNEENALYHEEIPLSYVHEGSFGNLDFYFTVTLEYGPDHAKVDPFDISVVRVAQNDASDAFNAQYLHPIIRYFYRGKLISEHHLAENLENDWSDIEAHQKPLKNYFDVSIKDHQLSKVV